MAKFGLSKSQKILNRSEFIKISAYGKKNQDFYFVVLVMPGKSACPRLGITVSKRVGHAVTRNRLKRLIREWFRINKSSIQGCWDINVIAKKPAADLASRQAFNSLEKIFKKNKIL